MIFGLDAFAPAIVALGVILLFAAFAFEWRTPEVSASVCVGILLGLGILNTDDILGVLSNSAPLTIGAMFIISAALVRTGAIDAFARLLTGWSGSHPRKTRLVFLLSVIVFSAFLNNTPLVMLMIPVAVALSHQQNQSPSKFLIPLSFAAILGGTCTLIGTSTNILVDGVARDHGLAPFHIFEIAPLGAITAVLGLAYLTFTQRLLPDRVTVTSILTSSETQKFMVEVVIEDGSPHVGRHPSEIPMFSQPDRLVVDVVRGDLSLRRDMKNVRLQPGDIVVLRSPVSEVLTLREAGVLGNETEAGLQSLSTRHSAIVEAIIPPGSKILGDRLRALRPRRRYGVYPLALHRHGANLESRFEDTPLEIGDTLLLEGAPEDIRRLVEDLELVNVAEPRGRAWRRDKAWIAIAVLFGIVAGAALGWMPIVTLAVIGAALVLGLRCVEAEEAFEAVDWRILTLILAMLALGRALDKTGLIRIIVDVLHPYLEDTSPMVALALIYVISSLLTEVVTNNAVAVLLTPIAISLAQSLGADPRGFVVAVMFAASASFLTPIGYQTNTLVYSAGGYRFADFTRFGAPLNLLLMIAAILLIPMFWPF